MPDIRRIKDFARAAFGGVALVGLSLLLSGCFGPGSDSVMGSSSSNAIVNNVSKFSVSAYGVAASPRLTSSADVPKGGGRYMVGTPYKIAGRWYHPAENTSYDQTGTASWYGPNFHGRLTANGEIFDQFHLSAAHPTLPLPSYVRVKNLSNGRSIVVRVNDRGPFSNNRLIDLSKRSAEVLGFINSGTAQVRVTYLGRAPVEGDDTRYLVARIDAPGATDISPSVTQRPPGIISRQNGGLLGAFTSLFSYSGADQRATIISEAHAAANAVGTSDKALQSWKNSVEGTRLTSPIDLGVFTNSELSAEIATKFAFLASVEINTVPGEGAAKVRLLITNLKRGVLLSDVAALRTSLGI